MFVCHDVSWYDFKGNFPRFKKFQKLSSLEQVFSPSPKILFSIDQILNSLKDLGTGYLADSEKN